MKAIFRNIFCLIGILVFLLTFNSYGYYTKQSQEQKQSQCGKGEQSQEQKQCQSSKCEQGPSIYIQQKQLLKQGTKQNQSFQSVCIKREQLNQCIGFMHKLKININHNIK